MPNRNYIRGRNKEYAAERYLNSMYLTFRSAGSHGPFDVIGIGKNNLMLVQLKRKKDSPKTLKGWRSFRTSISKKAKKIYKENEENIPEMAWVCLWCWLDYNGWAMANYDGNEVVVRFLGKDNRLKKFEKKIKEEE